ncbi:zinc finger CCCH domain-containing protein 14 isoform X2 [Mercurialis annua]|nr:zinc finger CCCH domain-containing protein 14 isoform X2 [Mercurialis annua]
MEKPASSLSDPITGKQESKSKLPSPSDHDDYDDQHQEFASNFTTLFHSIFPPKPSPVSFFSITPSSSASSPSSSAATDDIFYFADTATEKRLHQASLILEYQDLCDHYDLCLRRLQSLYKEIESLRQENDDLRLCNNDLVKLLSISSYAATQNRRENIVEENQIGAERVILPKSISVRSSGYLKMNRQGTATASSSSNRPRGLANRNLDHQLSIPGSRVCVPAGGNRKSSEEEAMEMDVYNQGMWKTELCNKWQETGTCPYGDHCQFAHGITELRAVVRHPRYKTQVCRMVVAGQVCPYGHRCHFRHSLTDQDRLVMGPR